MPTMPEPSRYAGINGLAVDCIALKSLLYLFLAGLLLSLAGLFVMDNEYYWIYATGAVAVASGGMFFLILSSKRCSAMWLTEKKETITVGIKNAVDTLQLLELKDVGNCKECGSSFKGCVPIFCPSCGKRNNDPAKKDDPLVGTYRYCMMSKVQIYFTMAAYAVILLFSPPLIRLFMEPADANITIIILAVILLAIFLFAFWVEYYTCCKRSYRASSDISEASIVRHRWVSYIEFGRIMK